MRSKRGLLNVVLLLVVAVTLGYLFRDDVLEATIFTGEQATLNTYYGHQATDYFTVTWSGGDEESTYAFSFLSPDSSAEWAGAASQFEFRTTKKCTLWCYGDSSHYIDDDPIELLDNETWTVQARVESIKVKSTAAGTCRCLAEAN